MKAFITGGTGFIGSHLIDHLLNKGIQVYALVRNLNNLKWLEGYNIHLLEGDLFSIPSLPLDIDFVFHLAGLTKACQTADYYTVNQQGTASLFQSLISQKISPKKVFLLSSLAASGPSRNGKPVKENCPASPITPYGKSKYQGECEALRYKDEFPVFILRVGAVYGPRDKDFVSYFKIIKRGILPSLGSGQRFVSLCYVKDIVRAFDLALQKNPQTGEIFHIADPQPYSWDDFGKIAGQVMNKNLKRVKIPLFLGYTIASISELTGKIGKNPRIINRQKYKEMKQKGWVADTEKAQKALSFHPEYSIRKALQETIDWYIQRGWL